MPTLNIQGKRVQVDDSFLSLSPEQQNATVEEIAEQMGVNSDPSLNTLSEASQKLGSGAYKKQQGRSLVGGGLASASGLTDSIPVVGPLLQKGTDVVVSNVEGAFTGQDPAALEERYRNFRAGNEAANPEASIAGRIAGSVGSVGAMGVPAAGAKALGLTGGLGARVANSALSSQGVYTADQLARGERGLDATGYGLPAVIGGAAPLASKGVEAAGGKIADAVTGMAQRGVTKQATTNAPTGQQLRSAASSMFEQSKDGDIMVTRPAFQRLYDGIKSATGKFRPNPNLDPKSIGALQVISDTLDDVMRPGSNVLPDIQDLHILRQAAQKAAISTEGRDQAIANRMIDQINDFVRTLKPADIAGQADPKAASNALLSGISTWSKAGKVGMLEEAVRVGEAAASGPQNGIQNAFRAIVKNKKLFNQFSDAEKRAIQDVANGTGVSEMLRFFGKGGVGSGGNTGLGAFLTGAAGTGLGPVGPFLTVGGASVARKGSEVATRNLADQAMKSAATGGIPAVSKAPNLLLPASRPIDLLMRGAAVNQLGSN